MSRVTLPVTLVADDFRFVVRAYSEALFDDVFALCRGSMSDSTGIGEGEFTSEASLRHMLDDAVVSATLHDADAGAEAPPFGLMLLYPTPLVRSAGRPLMAGGYFVIAPSHRGRRLQRPLWELTFAQARDAGVSGLLGRFAYTARTPVPSLRAGWQFIGTIPRGVKVKDAGWVFDMIGYCDLRHRMTPEERNKFEARRREVPAPPPRAPGATSLSLGGALLPPPGTLPRRSGNITIRGADPAKIQIVEDMIREAAETGDGFNLDEFCPQNGNFLHKFIRDPRVLVAMENDDVIGAAVCGESSLARTSGSLYTAYFLVNRKYRRRGVASTLLNVVSDVARKRGFVILFLDVYANNAVALQWLLGSGFVVTGSAPDCGHVVGRGFTHALLMYKQLEATPGGGAARL